MKRIYLFLSLASISLFANAQFDKYKEIELITFESESNYFKQGTPTTNIWQIGQPSKLIFTEAYSAPNAIITDTLNTYPANNHSWFDLVLPLNDFLQYYYSVNISFFHKINTDTLMDGGYITVSYDMGETWQNVINDTCDWFNQTPLNWGYSDKLLYTNKDTLFNGEKGFSGIIDEWQEVMFEWVTMAVKNGDNLYNDTMIVRFNFISDTAENNREGWMIDNLRLIVVDHGGNIHENPINSNLEIFPNPVHDNSIIQTKDKRQIKYIQVYNLTGQLLREEIVGDYSFNFKRKGLPSGTFLVKCVFTDETRETLKMIIQ